MKKTIIAGSVLLFLLNSALAQTTERIQINLGNFVVPQKGMLNRFTSPKISQGGIAYQHQFTPRFGIRLAYSEWLAVSEYNAPSGSAGSRFAANEYDEEQNYYSDCTALDLVGNYRILTRKAHEIYVGTGPSYIRVERTEYLGYFPLRYSYRKIGMLAEAGYNFIFCQRRLSAGLSATLKAHKDIPLLLYTSINIGYNFNWKIKKMQE